MKQNVVVKLTLIVALITSSIISFSGYIVLAILFLFLMIKGELKQLCSLLLEKKLILYFLIYIMFSLVKSNYKIDSLLGIMVIFFAVFIYFVIKKYVISFIDTIDIFKYFIISNIIISAYGIIQFYFIDDAYFSSSWIDNNVYNISMRAYSSLINPNVLAGYLVFCICLQLTSLENIKSRKMNVISLIVSSFCLILTYSRGAWLSLFIIVFLLYFYRQKVVYIIYSLSFFISLILVNGNNGIERISLNKSLHDHSLQYRIEIYKSAFKIIKEHFFFGTGLNTMKHYINYYSQVIKAPVDHAHNIILNIFCEAGFIGLIFFGIILVTLIKKIYLIYKLEDKIFKDIAISSVLAFLSIFIHGFIDAAIIAPQFLFFVVFIYSFIMNIKYTKYS